MKLVQKLTKASNHTKKQRSRNEAKASKVIAEMSENYNVSIDEIEIPSSWTNKTAFTVKGEPNKKTIEEIAASMVAVASEKNV